MRDHNCRPRGRMRPVFCLLAALGVAYAQSPPVRTVAIGHETREDDWPSIAASPDGSFWAAWLSFGGDRDDVAIRQFRDGVWRNLLWVPGTSGDSFLPQVAVDAHNRVWVVWSQRVGANWDLYARRFDGANQQWGSLERLTSDASPDINPRLAGNGKGQFTLVWQGFRDGHSNIFLKTFDGERWSGDVRVTSGAWNDWEPAVAVDSKGTAWVAYDSFRNGNYDVFVSSVRAGKVQGQEMPVAATPGMEARATVALDTADRVWVAWEAGAPNWGKDNGYVIRSRQPGVPLGGKREVRIRCYDGGRWRVPEAELEFPGKNAYQPHVFSDGRGSVWMIAKTWNSVATGQVRPSLGYFEYWITRLNGGDWKAPVALPDSKGRSSTRMNAALASDGALWMVWPTDSRREPYYHRPLRQRIYAAVLPAPGAAKSIAWSQEAEETLKVKPGHADEAGDLKAIRGYTAAVDGRPHHILRGDFHRHTELSWDGSGGSDGSLQDFYRYMIDVAGMDFGASTDHQGGHWPYWWWYTQKMTDMYHVPGAYTAIFGFERSIAYPDGHRNVFFARRSDSRVVPFYVKLGLAGFDLPVGPVGDEPSVNTSTGWVVENDTKLLYEELRTRNALSIPHTSGTKQGTDWRDNDPQVEPVVEIFQGLRTSYEALGAPLTADPKKDAGAIQQFGYQPQGMVSNAWTKGYRLGVIASSDHSSTHISYAMVYTDDSSREGILNAIRKRHTYGAMDNIILDVGMGEHFMGDEFAAAAAEPIRVKARGTCAVARVDVIRDNQVVYTAQPGQSEVDFTFKDTSARSGRHFYYVRLEQQDAMLAWSSPLFVEIR